MENQDNINNSSENSSIDVNQSNTQIDSSEINPEDLFQIDENIEKEVLETYGTPNWGEMIFGLFDLNLRKKLIETSKKNEGYWYFILGITKEYGIDTEIDYKMAFDYYKKAANLKESFALYKLYSIYCYQNELFKVERDRQKEIFYLLESIAFSDAAFFINNDTFFKIDIHSEINLIFDLESNLVKKLNNLFKNMAYLEENKDDLKYLESIIFLKFLSEKHDIDIYKQHEIFDEIRKLAENMHLESCYKLAVIYRQSKDIIKNNFI